MFLPPVDGLSPRPPQLPMAVPNDLRDRCGQYFYMTMPHTHTHTCTYTYIQHTHFEVHSHFCLCWKCKEIAYLVTMHVYYCTVPPSTNTTNYTLNNGCRQRYVSCDYDYNLNWEVMNIYSINNNCKSIISVEVSCQLYHVHACVLLYSTPLNQHN